MKAIQLTDERCEDWRFIIKIRNTDGEVIITRKNIKQNMEDTFYLSKKLANEIVLFILDNQSLRGGTK